MTEDVPRVDDDGDVCKWLTTRDAEGWPHLIPLDGRLHTLEIHCQCGPLVQHWRPGYDGAVFHFLPLAS